MTETPTTPAAPRATSGWRLALSSFVQNRLAVLGVGIIVLLALFCFVGPHLYVTEQTAVDPVNSLLPPDAEHPLGTDAQGFDVLGRIMQGGQASLQIGLFAALIATAFGTLYGTVAGLAGGVVDGIMMRVVDTLLSIPFLFIVLIAATRFSSSVLSLSLILGRSPGWRPPGWSGPRCSPCVRGGSSPPRP